MSHGETRVLEGVTTPPSRTGPTDSIFSILRQALKYTPPQLISPIIQWTTPRLGVARSPTGTTRDALENTDRRRRRLELGEQRAEQLRHHRGNTSIAAHMVCTGRRRMVGVRGRRLGRGRRPRRDRLTLVERPCIGALPPVGGDAPGGTAIPHHRRIRGYQSRHRRADGPPDRAPYGQQCPRHVLPLRIAGFHAFSGRQPLGKPPGPRPNITTDAHRKRRRRPAGAE